MKSFPASKVWYVAVFITFLIIFSNPFRSFSNEKQAHYNNLYSGIGNFNGQDSMLIAFSSDASANNKKQIFIMGTHGENVKQVCFLNNLDCIYPRFSPDGRKIVFTGTNVISDFIYMIDLDDTATFSFPVFIDGGSNPHWSPDGKSLVYQSEKNMDNNVYILDLNTDSSSIVSDGSMSSYASFSPDGRKIIYSSSLEGNFDLVVLDLDDTTEDAETTIADTKDAELYGTYSPDGNLIAYASFDINYKGTVHVCNNDGSHNISISRGMGSSYSPKFSPDGNKIAFLSGTGGNMEIYICNPDGSGMKNLERGNTQEFNWSGDSQEIVYDNLRDNSSSINIININTGKSENLTGDNANNINPNIQK